MRSNYGQIVILGISGLHYKQIYRKSNDYFLGSTSLTNNFCPSRVTWKHSNSGLLFCFKSENPSFVTRYGVVEIFRGAGMEFI